MQWSHIRSHESGTSPGWCSIVGAPRCGTTSLARYLGSNPNICPANVKEPHYFSRREFARLSEGEFIDRLIAEYLDHFFPGREPGQVLLDGSVSYLYAPERLKPALDAWPDAKFIIAIRNPLEMLPSLHQRHICNGDEDESDFERAWSLVGDRRRGQRIPRTCADPRLLDYEEIGRLGKYVGQFFDIVGRERCFVSVFDDLVADPAIQYRRILDFLALPPDERCDFAPFRSSTGVRSVLLQRLLKRPPVARSLFASEAALRREGIAINKRVGNLPGVPALKAFRKRLLKWNRTSAPSRQLSEELRTEMIATFAVDVAKLSALLGRDFSHWLTTDCPIRPSQSIDCDPFAVPTGMGSA
ncbi:sulfotransferase [Sphingomonas sp. HDW15A]|uniref:sulfotransferase family protein n=1 Tax=Sphingomonas sp. HDW15A TaxID=2714942 RepID=UPI00140C49B3|nr:sulfotransferase [Sphingomonas sp. HDW15A]QIK95364.1 sulfotransferase [Sphingomonas sp. HDW15A]